MFSTHSDPRGRSTAHGSGYRCAAWLYQLIPAGFLFALAFGCDSGPRTGDVKGTVTFKGAPVREGLVTYLNPVEGGGAESKIDGEGNYEMKKVVVGDYLVIVTPLVEIKDTDPGKSPPAPVEKPAKDIPVKYRQQGTSPLKAKVAEGKNVIDLPMTK